MMSLPEDCRRIRELIPGHALDALDPGEHSLVQQHLSSCPDCSQALAAQREVVEGLLHAPPPSRPPAQLRERVLSALPDRAPARSLVKPAARSWLRWVGAAAAVGLLLVNTALLLELRGLRSQQSELQTMVDRNQMALAVQSYPGSQAVEFQADEVFGTFVYDPGRSVSVLYAWGLQPLPEGRVYQAWFTDAEGQRVTGGVFAAQDPEAFTIVVLWAPTQIGDYQRVGVTVEPQGGSDAPSGSPVLTAELSN